METHGNRCKQPGFLKPEDPSKMSLSFAGCGFLCIYHAGVCAAIKEYAPQLTRNKMYGASAGSIVAAGLLCNVCMSEAIMIMLGTVSKANSKPLQTLSPDFDLIGIVREGLKRMLPENAHEICSGRLFISLTRYKDFKNVVVSNFETRDELIQAILCSSFIPFYCGFNPPKFQGVEYCDGGLSDNQPIYDRNTITVSPFCGESDICPNDADSASILGVDFYNTSIRITTNNLFRLFTTLFPPSLDICAKICRQGFQDALVLLNKKGLAPCVRCLAYQANPLIFPPEEVARAKAQSLISSKSRKKLESECDVWHDSLLDTSTRPTTDSLFPPILQKAIDDAKAAENRFLRYLNSFKIFRWGRRFVAPAFFPLDCTLLAFRTIYNYTTSDSTTDFFMQRFYSTLDFILAEIAKNNLLYCSKISSQLSPLFDDQSKSAIMYRLKKPSDVHNLPKELIGEPQVSFEDSLQRLLEFDTKRDEILIYFYTNFNIELQAATTQTQRRSSRSFHSLKRPSLVRGKLSQTIGTLAERPEESTSPDSNKAEDSGYTEPESNGNFSKKRRDTCCSPIHNYVTKNCPSCGCCNTTGSINVPLINNDGCTTNPACARRHTFAGTRREFGSTLNKSALSGPAAFESRPLSSDSDAEDNNEKLFVPNRQHSNERGYEGASDTDN